MAEISQFALYYSFVPYRKTTGFYQMPRNEIKLKINKHIRSNNHLEIFEDIRLSNKSIRSQDHEFDKNQYLRAVYKFLVPKGVLKLNWSQTIEVHLCDCEKIVCPICLQDPVAGRITRCGHIFCFPCILQFFTMTSDKYPRCPVCWKCISIVALKCFKFCHKTKFVNGSNIDLLLMRICHQNNLVEPVDISIFPDLSTSHFNGPLIAVDDVEQCLEDQRDRQRAELEFRLQCDLADGASLSAEFDQIALNNIENLEHSFTSVQGDVYNGSALNDQKSYSYFYQSNDGQRIYMHPLNVKCLLKEYNDLTLCPRHVNANIVAIESNYILSANMSAYKYLRHLPVGSEFKFVEIDLSGIVSNEILLLFKEQIEKRRMSEKKANMISQLQQIRTIELEERKLKEVFTCRSISPVQTVPCEDAFPAVSEPPVLESTSLPFSYAQKAAGCQQMEQQRKNHNVQEQQVSNKDNILNLLEAIKLSEKRQKPKKKARGIRKSTDTDENHH
ncbi:hypothetical protein GJ496_009692 [Pomphorhynchus laevis]|nr:hypothetical protein GJ496_009692 [Pomphorhynchus laevis]